jgi:hypothetical protein
MGHAGVAMGNAGVREYIIFFIIEAKKKSCMRNTLVLRSFEF